MEKKYFYLDENGKMLRFLNCIRCSNQFKQNQLRSEIFAVTNTVHMCNSCCKELNIKTQLSQTQIKQDREYLETESHEEKTVLVLEEQIEEVEEIVENESVKSVEEIKKPQKSSETIKEDKFLEKNIVYVVQCKDGTYYSGMTSDLDKAIKNHNSGCGSDFTKLKERRPVHLVISKIVKTVEEAKKVKKELQTEYKIK